MNMKMNIIRLLVTAVMIMTGVVSRLWADDRWETLQAIHMIENPNNRKQPGAHGELGAYQFRPTTWRQHTRMPFQYALHRSNSDQVAVAHYEWLTQQLRNNGVDPTPYNIAMAWNAGIGAVVSGRVPRASRQYATRVCNIASELRRSQVAVSIPQKAPMERIVLSM
jgi:hypothetical protein